METAKNTNNTETISFTDKELAEVCSTITDEIINVVSMIRKAKKENKSTDDSLSERVVTLTRVLNKVSKHSTKVQ